MRRGDGGVDAEEIDIGGLELGEGVGDERAIEQVAGGRAVESGDDGAVVEGVFGFHGEKELGEIGEGIEEDCASAAVDERPDLFGEEGEGIDAEAEGILGGDGERADGADHFYAGLAGGILGELGGGPVDFADAAFGAEIFKAESIGIAAIGFDEEGTGIDGGGVSVQNGIGVSDGKMGEAEMGG